jgi:hypothetical protein
MRVAPVTVPARPRRAPGWGVAIRASSARGEAPASVVAFLRPDGAGCVTGQSIRLDGGPARSA